MIRTISLFLLFTFAMSVSGCRDATPVELTVSDLVMGIPVAMTAWASDPDSVKIAIDAAFVRMREIDAKMSDYKEDSELSAIKQAAGQHPVTVSAETFALIQKAIGYSEQTDGAFDITVRPLITLWRERNEVDREANDIPPNNHPPTEEEIAETLGWVGANKIVLDPELKTVYLPARGMAIDLGAIAKGYAVDEAIRSLQALGIANCLVEAGGDLYAAGTDTDGKPWSVGIRNPYVEKNVEVLRAIEVSDRGVATSGDYERYLLIDGQRFNHILDPRTGKPVDGLHSVTVIAKSCMEADMLSTAITVLGSEKGLILLEKFQGASFYAVPAFQSPGFGRYLMAEETASQP